MKERKVIRNLEGNYWNKETHGFYPPAWDNATIFNNFSQAMLEARNASKIALIEIVSVWQNTDVEEML